MEASIKELVAGQRTFFSTHTTKDVEFRLEQLHKLKSAIIAHEKRIGKALCKDCHKLLEEALYKDLHKSVMEAYTTEIAFCVIEINNAIKNLRDWTKPTKAKGSAFTPLARAYVSYEPYGVVLIISPWNYPFQLTISPLTGAIAAGNCAILKPSELSPNTSKVIQEMIGEFFDEEYIAVVQGGADVAQELLQQKLDYIFYTGGGVVGKAVMKAAAEHLTPVILELGGKSPCIVDEDIDLEKTARRITWGKFLNSGQTCIAPDYIMVHRSVKGRLVDAIKEKVSEFYGTGVKSSKYYGRIINEKHFARLSKYLVDGEIIVGGETDSKELYIAPTLLDGVSPDSNVMQEEIFGPILPVLGYSDISEAIDFVNGRPKPLALYLFSNDKDIQEKVLHETSSGGVCINDTVIHFGSIQLPYGGVGNSGFGRYHGKASFELLSNRKSVLKQTVLFDFNIRYPPYTPGRWEVLRRFLR